MSQSPKVEQGRVDHLAKGVFKRLLKEVANPEVRFACKMFEEEIDEAFTENLGPGTQAHEVGRRIIRAIEGDR
jgi:hypothetical protein